MPLCWLQPSQLWVISKDTVDKDAAALLMDFLVNDMDAGKALGIERGIPANADIRAMIAETGDITMAKLFLQPLIENSIYHGAKEKEGLTTITVSAKTQGGRLLIDVCDDGAGMDAAQVEEVDHDMRSSSRKHIGLGYIYRRLETLYHDDFQMSIHINQTGGITVSINIPARKNT